MSTSPGNRVSLNFVFFDLEESDHCNRDYVEIHGDSPEGPLLGHFCGNSVPANITVGNSLWIKFRSDGQGAAGGGFVAEYSLRE